MGCDLPLLSSHGVPYRWHLLLPDQTVKRAPEGAPPAPPAGLLSSLWRWLIGGRSLKAVAEPALMLESARGPPGLAGSLDPAGTESRDALQLPPYASVGHAAPDCRVGGQDEPAAAQLVPCSDTDSSKGANYEQGGRWRRRLLQLPRLWRKDAFKLSDQEAESLTQRLGIGTASSPAPGTSQDEAAGQSPPTHSSSRPTTVNQQPEQLQIASGVTRERADNARSDTEAIDFEADAELDSSISAGGSRSRCLGQLDPACYNETTRCNQQRWLHLHGASGGPSLCTAQRRCIPDDAAQVPALLVGFRTCRSCGASPVNLPCSVQTALYAKTFWILWCPRWGWEHSRGSCKVSLRTPESAGDCCRHVPTPCVCLFMRTNCQPLHCSTVPAACLQALQTLKQRCSSSTITLRT